MRIRTLASLVAMILAAPTIAIAKPPAHAPAHGYRAKQGQSKSVPMPEPRNGIEVVFDSERGIYVGVDLPNVFFHDGHYFREQDGHWQVSLTGGDGWTVSASAVIPAEVVKAKSAKQPPAKAAKVKRGK